MSKTTLKTTNIDKPAPRWFRITKNVLTILFDTGIAIALLSGHTDNSKEILIARIIYSGVMNSLSQFLANGEQYSPVTPNINSIGKN